MHKKHECLRDHRGIKSLEVVISQLMSKLKVLNESLRSFNINTYPDICE